MADGLPGGSDGSAVRGHPHPVLALRAPDHHSARAVPLHSPRRSPTTSPLDRAPVSVDHQRARQHHRSRSPASRLKAARSPPGLFETSVELLDRVDLGRRTSTYSSAACRPTSPPGPPHTLDRPKPSGTTVPLPSSPDHCSYLAIFDTNGVPVWWRRSDTYLTFFATYGRTDTWRGPARRRPRGAPRSAGSTARSYGSSTPSRRGNDFHELQLLPNGHYLIAGNRRAHVSISPPSAARPLPPSTTR